MSNDQNYLASYRGGVVRFSSFWRLTTPKAEKSWRLTRGVVVGHRGVPKKFLRAFGAVRCRVLPPKWGSIMLCSTFLDLSVDKYCLTALHSVSLLGKREKTHVKLIG